MKWRARARKRKLAWRRRAAFAATACVVLMALCGVPAQASSSTAICTVTATLNLSPGLWYFTPTSGTNTSLGETGTLSCTGSINGKTITGPGSVGFDATYTNSTCAAVNGGGTWFFTVPTSGGPVHREGPYSGPAIGPVIPFQGWFADGYATGAGPVMPTQGDCLLSPLTKANLTAAIVMTSSG